MKKKKLSLTIQAIITVSVFLIIVYAVLGYGIITRARETLKDNIQSHMLDIANTAAANLDGDLLMQLKSEDKDTAAY